MGSNPTQGMDVCLLLFYVCVVLCVGSCLATGKARKGCRAIEEDSIINVTNGTRQTVYTTNKPIVLLLNTHEINWRHMRRELLKYGPFEINSKLKILIQESYLL
jgi:hypothetical protein